MALEKGGGRRRSEWVAQAKAGEFGFRRSALKGRSDWWKGKRDLGLSAEFALEAEMLRYRGSDLLQNVREVPGSG